MTIQTATILKKVNAVEQELQKIKEAIRKEITNSPKKTISIASKTAGILGKNFPTGLDYQKKIRSTWENRISKTQQ
jgi:hypothetical protein